MGAKILGGQTGKCDQTVADSELKLEELKQKIADLQRHIAEVVSHEDQAAKLQRMEDEKANSEKVLQENVRRVTEILEKAKSNPQNPYMADEDLKQILNTEVDKNTEARNLSEYKRKWQDGEITMPKGHGKAAIVKINGRHNYLVCKGDIFQMGKGSIKRWV